MLILVFVAFLWYWDLGANSAFRKNSEEQHYANVSVPGGRAAPVLCTLLSCRGLSWAARPRLCAAEASRHPLASVGGQVWSNCVLQATVDSQPENLCLISVQCVFQDLRERNGLMPRGHQIGFVFCDPPGQRETDVARLHYGRLLGSMASRVQILVLQLVKLGRLISEYRSLPGR